MCEKRYQWRLGWENPRLFKGKNKKEIEKKTHEDWERQKVKVKVYWWKNEHKGKNKDCNKRYRMIQLTLGRDNQDKIDYTEEIILKEFLKICGKRIEQKWEEGWRTTFKGKKEIVKNETERYNGDYGRN